MCFNCGQPDVSKNIGNNNALQQTPSNIVYRFIWLEMGFFVFLFLGNAAAKLFTVSVSNIINHSKEESAGDWLTSDFCLMFALCQ